MDPIYVDTKRLPAGDNCDFGLTGIELPSPDQVRSRAERDGIDTSKASRPDPVRFPELGMLVKWGSDITIAEGQCLWFLRQHLQEEVPVPTIYGWRVHSGQTFLYLELVNGEPLAVLWDELAEDDKLGTCKQLCDMITAWRRIKQMTYSPSVMERLLSVIRCLVGGGLTLLSTPKCRLSAINGEALRDILFHDGRVYPAGPFENVGEFHNAFASILTKASGSADMAKAREQHPELAGLTDDWRVSFTHADLDVSNIIVAKSSDGPIRVIAIVDWHQSGWYPEPWEWLKAQSVAEPRAEWVEKYLPTILEPAPKEYFYAWEYINMSTI